MTEITQARVRELFNYDLNTGDFLRIKARTGGKVGSVRTVNGGGYYQVGIDGSLYSVHRLIWLYVHGYSPVEIDHINGDKLNNRLLNLRDVTHAENARNSAMPKNNKSGKVGVSWAKHKGKWRSTIKNIHIGFFDEIEDAMEARKQASLQYGFHPNHGR